VVIYTAVLVTLSNVNISPHEKTLKKIIIEFIFVPALLSFAFSYTWDYRSSYQT